MRVEPMHATLPTAARLRDMAAESGKRTVRLLRALDPREHLSRRSTLRVGIVKTGGGGGVGSAQHEEGHRYYPALPNGMLFSATREVAALF